MKLNYKKLGEGKPLIILHGLFGSADNWFGISKELKEDFTLYLIDQRNHGDSPHADAWNYEVMGEDLKELMEDENIAKAYFMGHSMGGKTAMNFALAYPEKVEKLIVADIAPRYYPVHHQEILKGLNSLDLSKINSRKEADDQLAAYVPNVGERQFLLKSLTRESGGFTWKINLRVITDNINNVGEALRPGKSFEGPTLFLSGAKSTYIQESDLLDMKEFFPNYAIEFIAEAGHWLHAEQPEAVTKEIKKFLS